MLVKLALLQYPKAFAPIDVMLFGILIPVRDVQLRKVSSPIVVIP